MRSLPVRICAALSTRRRHPVAFLVLLLLGLALAGGAYAAVAPTRPVQASATGEDLVEQGRKLYLVGCSSCHGKNAEGVMTRRGNQYGPPLIGVGAASVDFQVSTGRMPATQTGAQVPEKDPVYSPEETAALAAYIASLGPGPEIPTEEQYSIVGLSEEEIVRGGELWRTNCTACHNFAGQGGALPGGRYAPSLEGVDPIHIYEAMITGPQQMPVFSDSVITPDDKRAIIGYLKSLEQAPDSGGFGLGALGPVTEGIAAWLVGMGALVAAAVWIGAAGVRARK
ncbi:MAG: cytochrome c [Actinomycetota bacterium]|nr:cytochrome c [Actinomycetota bacterium]